MNFSIRRSMGILVVVLACAALISAQQNPPKASRVRAMQFHGDMAALLATLAKDNEVTIGMEADLNKPKSDITINLQNATLQDILNGIVQSEPRYRWRENGASIEVSPVNGGITLMDTPIGNFQVKDVSRAEAINQLMNLPEVQAVAISMKLNRKAVNEPVGRTSETKVSVSLDGVTLRQALNRIVEQSGERFWLFRSYPDGSFSIGTSTQ